MSLIAALLLGLSPAASLIAAERIELPTREVRLGDVAEWQGQGGLGSIVIARLPEGRSSIRLSRGELTTLIRRRVPGIEIGAGPAGSMLLVAPAKVAADKMVCLQLVSAKAAGEELVAGDVMPAPCPETMSAQALRFDPETSANVALRPLEAGEVIRHAVLAQSAALRRGERLSLASRVGPVTIERPVTLVQNARAGDRKIFVRTKDGDILAAQLQAEGAQSR